MNYMDKSKSPVECDWHFITPETKAGRMMIKRAMRSEILYDGRNWCFRKRMAAPTYLANGRAWLQVRFSTIYDSRRGMIGHIQAGRPPKWWDAGWGFKFGLTTSRSGVLGQWHWAVRNTDEQLIREEQRWYYEQAKTKREEERKKRLEEEAIFYREIGRAFQKRGGRKSRKQKQLIALGIPA